MTKDRKEYWAGYYNEVAGRGNAWLDYSNARVQTQTFGLCLEAAGPVGGKRCLDVGCGWGQFSRTLAVLQAGEVVGIDMTESLVASHRKTDPHIRWLRGDIQEASFRRELGEYDLIFILEVLQVVPFEETIRNFWSLVRPGGRLVAMLPNRECPIIARTIDRFEGKFDCPSPAELAALLSALPGREFWALRGLTFMEDQRLAPYGTSPWSGVPDWPEPPNRLQFVIERKGDRPPEAPASA